MELKNKKWLPLLLALLLALAMIPALAQTEAEEPEAEQEHFFAQLELTYLDGTPFDTSVFLGKPVFLNIWATWCPPCVTEMPILDELAKEYEDKISIIGLHAESLTVSKEGELVDDEEKIALAKEMKENMSLNYALINPDRTLFILMNDPQYGLQVTALPTTWMIDAEGYVREIIPGAKTKEGWAEAIDSFLEKMQEEEDSKTEG